ncbi:hypothetical protein [Flammeovirga kamogawensis]|uniref:Porin family protein n=1 Tax=Flammeovirga kamogawensis TaxID=373891 RepID=A0ABX8GTW1_9BACT|nr:hypothetical protein [Flammeovirga kamogawensis]MBB6459912.1 hypothetical protein [Flammeovirga kamogawensis]QWG07035.1 hypothetical protein KM029_17295 [Flammeovirga kamogawensis]TRX68856.1 hypothetical protein EO216_12280 [Flammeovirga kamogawensis]
MKKLLFVFVSTLLLGFSTATIAQDNTKAGAANLKGPGTLNIGLTTGFSNNTIGFMADYEIAQLGRDFTVGAFVDYQSWSGKGSSFGAGARFRWYADRVLNITNPKWDVYAVGDVGFKFGEGNALHWGIGVGAKYHISDKIGIQGNIGTGAQIGICFGL